MRIHTTLAGGVLFGLFSTAVSLAGPLPNGASSLVENYEDWVVACQAPEGEAACVMRQVQSNRETGQRVLSAEFQNGTDGNVQGVLLMPFGLALDQGVALKFDDQAGPQLSFSTCLPSGCVVPVRFSAEQVGMLQGGSAMNVTAMGINSSEPVAFNISLDGFTDAYNRLTQLTK